MVHRDRRAAVVGAGVIGAAIAWELAQRDWAVTVLDHGPFGREASAAAAGMLCPGAEVWDRTEGRELFAQAGRVHGAWTARLEEETGISVHVWDTGLIRLFGTPDAGRKARDAVAAAPGSLPLVPRLLDGGDLRRLEPDLTGDVSGALLFESDRQLEPVRLLKALERATLRTGVEIRTSVPVLGIRSASGRVLGVRTVEGDLDADAVFLAAGAWSAALAAPWVHMPIRPLKGQMISVRAPDVRLRHMVQGGGGVIPRLDGSFTLGATLEEAGYDQRPTVRAIRDVYEGAARTVPALAEATFIETWTGLRPGTPDTLPYLGDVPGIEGLYIATGHSTVGILLAPLTASLVSGVAEGHTPSLDLTPYRPDRHDPRLRGTESDGPSPGEAIARSDGSGADAGSKAT